MTDAVDDFLAHYGVKGMKWGVRKATKLAERSASNSESTPYRQAKIDTKARNAAVKVKGKGSTVPKNLTRGVIKERMANDPEYKAAKAKYDKDKYDADSAKIAAAAIGVIAGPYLLSMLDTAVSNYARDHVVDSLHKATYKSFEKSAYGQRRREEGKQFVDNTGHQVVGPGIYEVARRR
jgi:hypothetical protein